ncbi:proteasome inhibitor PI31 family protein [Aspergillus candidus]|uniref:PI31 proteasome regulator N-terminal-domain-containing protein n=1 Tax=Aspergillus candidus TaxID=41067 RepID=A0A2I2F4N3_ASPCN|nr:PI31 proteasome regulator N-terminal-domain-containing protein [Aspergillus candidus]PLB35600.1 PI31 proteasome regulator N-terminal-domain-containing protein [Aspergillus candidus]
MVGNTDPLSPDNIVALATRALGDDDSTSNTLQSPYEAVALIGHACMLAVGFRLVGLGEDDNLENPDSPTLPAQWNAATTYAFRYAHSQSSMQYLLKVSRLGNNAVVFALALGDDRTTSFDIPVHDFVSPSSLPLSTPATPPSALRDVFISASRLTDLIGLFRINVIQRLAPGLYKEGYEASNEASNEARRERQPGAPPRHDPLRDDPMPAPARPYPFDDALAIPPRRPVPAGDFAPPGFEDEFEIQRPPRGFAPGFGGRHPMNIGDRDLYPPGLGPHDPIRGGIGPGLGGGGGSGGMHPTFDDPLFGGQGGGEGGYNPQAPPGARYDPVGPGGPPFGRGPGRSGGRGGRGFGGGFGGMGGFGGDII